MIFKTRAKALFIEYNKSAYKATYVPYLKVGVLKVGIAVRLSMVGVDPGLVAQYWEKAVRLAIFEPVISFSVALPCLGTTGFSV